MLKTTNTTRFKVGDKVIVPDMYRNLVVDAVYDLRDGSQMVRANFESGFGFYEAPAFEFELTEVAK